MVFPLIFFLFLSFFPLFDSISLSPLSRSPRCPVLLPNHPPLTLTSRIINGDSASSSLIPYTASIMKSASTLEWVTHCTATFISKTHLLTAAHCNITVFMRVAIKSRLSSDYVKDTSLLVRIRSVTIPPEYKHTPYNAYDIAIVELDLPPTGVKQMALLNDVSLPKENTAARVAGYGVTVEQGDGLTNRELHQVDIPIAEMSTCKSRYGADGNVLHDKLHICGGYVDKKGKKCGPCDQDSGAGLFVFSKNGAFVLVAVVSSGIGCGREDLPTVYSRVAAHLQWIEKTTGGGIDVVSEVEGVKVGGGLIGGGGIAGIVIGVLLLALIVGGICMVRKVRKRRAALKKMENGEDVWEEEGAEFTTGASQAPLAPAAEEYVGPQEGDYAQESGSGQQEAAFMHATSNNGFSAQAVAPQNVDYRQNVGAGQMQIGANGALYEPNMQAAQAHGVPMVHGYMYPGEGPAVHETMDGGAYGHNVDVQQTQVGVVQTPVGMYMPVGQQLQGSVDGMTGWNKGAAQQEIRGQGRYQREGMFLPVGGNVGGADYQFADVGGPFGGGEEGKEVEGMEEEMGKGEERR